MVVNLGLKGYCLRKIGRIINKTLSIVQYIVNKFKYTGSIKYVPRNPKRRIVSAREERYVVKEIREKILG